jgi:Ca2+-binding RTX toxin-like protein
MQVDWVHVYADDPAAVAVRPQEGYEGPGATWITGSYGDDILTGGDGPDTLLGLRGSDMVDGGAGDDVVRGGRGIDDDAGSDGDDTVFGGLGDDRSSGDAGDDVLFIIFGANTLTFVDNDGDDAVRGYKPGIDTFDLTAVAGLDDRDDLPVTDSGDDVLVDYGTGSFLLKNTDFSDVEASDFLV